MTLYWLSISFHLLAAALWLGHMFVWSLIVGPAMKRIEPPETADMLRERSLFLGGLGWPALTILILTGSYMLGKRGIGIDELVSGEAFVGDRGMALALKLLLVAWMIFYQAVFGHRHAPVAIYVNILAGVAVVGLSVVYVKGIM